MLSYIFMFVTNLLSLCVYVRACDVDGEFTCCTVCVEVRRGQEQVGGFGSLLSPS